MQSESGLCHHLAVAMQPLCFEGRRVQVYKHGPCHAVWPQAKSIARPISATQM